MPLYGAHTRLVEGMPTPATECRPHPKSRASFHQRLNITVHAPAAFIDMHDNDDVEEEHETAPYRTNKRSPAEMKEEDHVYVRKYFY